MTERRALLIGVPECDDTTFSSISQVVRNDIQKMHSALASSAYSIDSIGNDGQDPSGSRIRAAIRKACAGAPERSVLLLYFSGHGISINGVDYLVPSDAYRENGVLVPESLVPVIPDLSKCRAKLVVFFVDACRDDPAGRPSEGAWGGVLHYPAGGSQVMVAGCEPGQFCRYGEDGSVFTRTLAKVLDRRNPARTLSAVLAEVRKEMSRTTGLGDDRVQLPNAYPKVMARHSADTVICEGDQLVSAWRRAAAGNELWNLAADASESLREKVAALAEDCARKHLEVADHLREKTGMVDHWFDPNYPERVIDFTAQLFGEHVPVRPEEAAALIAAPFLRETVLAEGVWLAARIRPGDFKRSYETGERTDLELTHEMYPQVIRRAEGLARRGQQEAAETLVMWLVHRWLTEVDGLWKCDRSERFIERGASLLSSAVSELSLRECRRLMETLMRAVAAAPVDPKLEDRIGLLPESWRGHVGVLWLAGTLAADPRRMPTVIADHIGTGLELPLTSVKNAAELLRIQRRKSALDLSLICEHPAQHAAFEAVAVAAQHILGRLRCLSHLGPVEDALPVRITHEGVRADRPSADGAPVYQVPLTRFRLSEDKIRELLMGRQLYDDPSLAIRELYQNALDACRYRDTRLEGLRRRGRRPAVWEGAVTFRQGFEDGREYVECEDNGVGMGREVLEQVFAHAGERFVHLQEYRAEHALWQELDPPLRMVSNSQFGVGVFSYFMIADEILLVTRPVDQQGIPSPEGFTVQIASSGSLMQVTPSEEMLGGGTRIRLYLTGDEEEEKVSVLQTLRRLLWIAEYRVVASEHDSAPEEWSPRKLRYQDESAESLEYDRDLWWVSGEGGLAADGLRTNEEIYGLVVNLRDEHRPQFTVDRKKLRTWHEQWVNERIDKSLPMLMDWPGLSLSWLWDVTKSTPEVAQRVFDHLVRSGTEIQAGGGWGQGTTVPAAQVGCVPEDRELFDPKNWYSFYAGWFMTWRSGVWKRLVGGQRTFRRIPSALSVEGFPVAGPIDGALLSRLNWSTYDTPVPVEEIILATAHPKQRMSDLLRRMRRFAITGLDLRHLRCCPPVSRTFKEEDTPLAGALAAWTLLGLSRAPIVAGWLVRASAHLDQPLKEVLRRAAEIAPPGWSAPELDLARLGDEICTTAETKLVSRRLNGRAPWIEGELSPDHIAHAAGELGRDISQILQMCDRLGPLGVTVAGRDRYPETCERVEAEALRHLQYVGDRLTPIKLMNVAGVAGMSVQEARSALASLEERGLLRLPEIPAEVDLTLDADVIGFINSTMRVVRGSTRRQDFVLREPCLAVAGALSGRYWRRGPVGPIKDLVPFTAPETEITHVDIICLATMIYGSIGDARRAFSEAYPDVPLPEADRSCDDLQPWVLSAYLITPLWSWARPDWSLSAGHIVNGAMDLGVTVGEFLALLAPYRQFGAPIPDLEPEASAELADWHPDPYDVDMLTILDVETVYFDDIGYLAEIDALRLVQIAGRLGMTLTDAHQRLSKMVPLGLRLDYAAEAVPEGIVWWYDLLLLTVYLDGQAPAVSGRVDQEHLRRVAEETGESVGWLSDRLRIYAPLFSLTLPEESVDG
ncbi:caspase family protein [Streptosporangium sp. NPDC049078]|uniref:wHTH domain-containing protein n=1 Tax=Streptosporangium sp. NPDC049078 TaxID=3155767 RepID=UPI00342BD835